MNAEVYSEQGGRTCPLKPMGGGSEATVEALTRREFFNRIPNILIALSLLASGGFGAATIARFLQPPASDLEGRTKLGWLEVGSLSDFTQTPKRVDYGDEPVFVYFVNKKLVAFSTICPHVRCIVAWNPTGKPNPRTGFLTYDCPCHASSFDLAGRRLFGPAPRGLYAQKMKIVGNKLLLGGGTPPA